MSQFYNNNSFQSGNSGTITGTATTTDAIPTTILTFPLINNQSVTINGLFTAFETTSPNSLKGQLIAGSYRAGGGAILISPSYIDQSETAGFTTATFDLIVSGNNALVQVIGQAGLTIHWRVLVFFVYANA